MNLKRILGIGVAIMLLAAALGTGLVIAQQEGGKEQADAGPLQVPLVLTQQGRLLDVDDQPVTDPHDLTFYLYDDPVAGTLLWQEVHSAVAFDAGLYTVQLGSNTPLDPAMFNQDLYLAVSVDIDAEMALRIRVSAVPYALNTDRLDGLDTSDFWSLTGNASTTPGTNFLGTTDNVGLELQVNGLRALRLEPNASSPNLIGGFYGNSVTIGAEGATISGGGASVLPNAVTDDYGTIGGGGGNVVGVDDANHTTQHYGTIGGGRNNTAYSHATVGGGRDNTASGGISTIGGGWGNVADIQRATVGGGFQNISSGFGSTIGGGESNVANSGDATVGGGSNNVVTADYGTIAGGGPSDTNNPTTTNNVVYDDYGTIGGGGGNVVGIDDANTTNQPFATDGGGQDNTASSYGSTVSGGISNISSQSAATIGGGGLNTASGVDATVSGGSSNTAGGDYATVAGGSNNNASANFSTVSGGDNNTATGLYSFAAGLKASASHDGAFVWADSTNADFFSNAADQFNILASGGTRIFSNNTVSAGVLLAAGGNGWSAVSDKAYKENFALVDARNILEKLSEMPVGQYNLASQDPSIQHMGPTAQDFHAAFGLGESDTLINSLDTDGVALAAIQGLYQELLDRDARIAALEGAVGIGSVSTNNESLGFVWLVTWILMGGLLAVGVFIALRLRKGVRL